MINKVLLVILVFVSIGVNAYEYKKVYDNSINSLTWRYTDPNKLGDEMGWYDGRTLMSLMNMYKATGDINYLKKLIDNGEGILLRRNDTTHTDYDGVNRLGWVDIANECDLPYSWIVHAGMITYPLADFAQLVLNSPTDPNVPDLTNYLYNGKTFEQYANDFFDEVKDIIYSYEPDWNATLGAYEFPGDFDSDPECFDSDFSENDALPYNMSNAMGRTLVMMDKADLSNQYPLFLDHAFKLAYSYKANIDHATFLGGLENLEYNHLSAGIPHIEDVSHGSISIDFMRLCYEHGVVFNSSDLILFADYFSSALYQSATELDAVFNLTDLRLAESYLGITFWLTLNDFNLDLYRYIEDAVIEDLVKNKLFTDGRKILALSYLEMYKVKLWPVSYSRANGVSAAVADLHLGDLNGDGKDELVTVRNYDGHIDSYTLNIDGSLSSYAYNYGYGSASQWAGVTVGNFDTSTPEEEIAAVRNYDGKIFIWKANTNGTLTVLATSTGGSSSQWAGIEAGDFDPNTPGDEIALARNFDGDIFLYKYTSGSISLIDRHYAPGSASNWIDVTAGDFDGDGLDEIVGLRGYDEKLYVYDFNSTTGEIEGLFTEQLPSGGNYKAITAGDYDGDNIIELAVQYGVSGNMFFYEADGLDFVNDWTEYWSTGDNIYALGSGKFRTDQTGCEVFFVRSNQNIFGYTAGKKKIVIGPKSLEESNANTSGTNVYLYPNPTNKGWVNLATQNFDVEEGYGYKIIDIRGSIVESHAFHQGAVIDLLSLQSGVYIFQLDFNGEIFTKKLIVE